MLQEYIFRAKKDFILVATGHHVGRVQCPRVDSGFRIEAERAIPT